MIAFSDLATLFQILVIDLSLAGDNAIVVGMAASGLPAPKRKKAILAGIGAATLLRILFALFAVQMLHVVGLMAAGGLLLLWVAWKMFREIRGTHAASKHGASPSTKTAVDKKFHQAILQIVIADVSMSLDNVLAVAGLARDHVWVLVAGLTLSVILMGAAATATASLVKRYPWIAYLGLAVVLYAALRMIWDGFTAIGHLF